MPFVWHQLLRRDRQILLRAYLYFIFTFFLSEIICYRSFISVAAKYNLLKKLP